MALDRGGLISDSAYFHKNAGTYNQCVFLLRQNNIILAKILEKNHMKASFLFAVMAFVFAACNKTAETIINKIASAGDTGAFVRYTIPKGQQFCDQSGYRAVETSEMKFIVRFDSSAIYQTLSRENQYDINKLFGFSDNNADHHQYSARFGWRWSEGALRLFAYVYNEGSVTSSELTTVAIGTETACSIRVIPGHYIFTVNDVKQDLPRKATTVKGKGYQLYPYFGGDETAPHEIRIWMKEAISQ
jgi:hypothetical protein